MSGRYERNFTHYGRAVVSPARRIGCTPEEYAAHMAAGRKWCFRCRDWHDRGEFGPCRAKPDGLATMCRDGRRAYDRDSYARRQRGQAVAR